MSVGHEQGFRELCKVIVDMQLYKKEKKDISLTPGSDIANSHPVDHARLQPIVCLKGL
jgi:hypothetical protein